MLNKNKTGHKMEDTMQSQLMCVSVFAACVCWGGGVHVTTHRIFFFNIYFFGSMGSQHEESSLHHAGFFVAAHGFSMVCRLCRSRARGVLVLPPGIEPSSPALQGGFLTTGPPGKSRHTGFEGSRRSIKSVSFGVRQC